MIYILYSLAIAIVGILPFLMVKRPGVAGAFFPIYFLLIVLCVTGFDMTFAGPFYGYAGVLALFVLIVSAAVIQFAGLVENHTVLTYMATFLRASLGVTFLGMIVLNSTPFKAVAYAKLIGQVDSREWSKDIQPKDPRHMRMADRQNAIFRARKVLGQDGSIGSQFQLEDDEFTLQVVKGHLWYVAPLEFRSFSTWTSNDAAPGYVMASAENPGDPAQLVKFPAYQGMRFSPSAYFTHNLLRHIGMNGYIDKNFEQTRYEIDDNGHAWWIVSVGHPTLGWGGEVVDGVDIVDPADGNITFYPMGNIPMWVDNVFPASIAKSYIDWWGSFRNGWLNTKWGKMDIVQSGGDPTIIYDNAGEQSMVTDITSSNEKDDSLVGVMYTNSRTGKTAYYAVHGGATNDAILESVANNPQINYRHLGGKIPQLYNLEGTLASVVPLFNATDSFQGVAIVPIDNTQEVATGSTVFEALTQYQRYLGDKGGKTAISDKSIVRTVDGIVDRVSGDTTSTGTVYYLHVAGQPYLFTGSSGVSPKLPVTEKGDKVHLTYIDTTLNVVPLHDFDNLSLLLGSQAQR
jgi:hypothetical protein